mgnify:CR=1 FL=1
MKKSERGKNIKNEKIGKRKKKLKMKKSEKKIKNEKIGKNGHKVKKKSGECIDAVFTSVVSKSVGSKA